MQRRTVMMGAGLAWAGAVPGVRQAQAALPDVISAARPSVLPIGRLDPLASPRFGFRGTAFAVGDGSLVATNAHVVDDGKGDGPPWALQQRLPDGGSDWRRLTLLARDPEHDLALLRLEGAPLKPLPLGADGAVREGIAVALIGFPIGGILGFQPVTHRGIVSSIAAIALPAANASQLRAQSLSRLRGGAFDVYQLDANAYPGNSGGPVLDADTGDVIAVLNMVLVKGSREAALAQPTGISYAIPVRWLREMVERATR